MTAGVIFGVAKGTAVVSVAATLAATAAMLIARHVARDRVLQFANPKWLAIDKACRKDGFRVVLLLRLSPLLPFAASNYLFGESRIPIACSDHQDGPVHAQSSTIPLPRRPYGHRPFGVCDGQLVGYGARHRRICDGR